MNTVTHFRQRKSEKKEEGKQAGMKGKKENKHGLKESELRFHENQHLKS
jgi:hypothetical protein